MWRAYTRTAGHRHFVKKYYENHYDVTVSSCNQPYTRELAARAAGDRSDPGTALFSCCKPFSYAIFRIHKFHSGRQDCSLL